LETPGETSGSSATRLVFRALDLADVGSTRDFANAYLDDFGGALDVLVNNAGVMAVPSLERTRDGFELQVGVNHLGHHALTAGLFPALRASEDGRVATVSSEAHKIAARGLARDDLFGEKKYSAWGQYGQSKLANVLFAFELARRCPANVSSATLHPGAVDTELGRFLQPPEDEVTWWQKRLFEFVRDNFLKTPEQGAATSVYLARDIAKGEANGKYYVDCREKTPAKNCFDEEDAAWLWQRSAELTGVSFDSI
jgi:NAD(P)-dependent dehydrogenase (short-subunit alcohol dehydrogenase family)